MRYFVDCPQDATQLAFSGSVAVNAELRIGRFMLISDADCFIYLTDTGAVTSPDETKYWLLPANTFFRFNTAQTRSNLFCRASGVGTLYITPLDTASVL